MAALPPTGDDPGVPAASASVGGPCVRPAGAGGGGPAVAAVVAPTVPRAARVGVSLAMREGRCTVFPALPSSRDDSSGPETSAASVGAQGVPPTTPGHAGLDKAVPTAKWSRHTKNIHGFRSEVIDNETGSIKVVRLAHREKREKVQRMPNGSHGGVPRPAHAVFLDETTDGADDEERRTKAVGQEMQRRESFLLVRQKLQRKAKFAAEERARSKVTSGGPDTNPAPAAEGPVPAVDSAVGRAMNGPVPVGGSAASHGSAMANRHLVWQSFPAAAQKGGRGRGWCGAFVTTPLGAPGRGIAAAVTGSRGAAAAGRVSQCQRFQNNIDGLAEFLHFTDRVPDQNSTTKRERQLANFLAKSRRRKKTLNERQRDVLLNVHPNILNPSFSPVVDPGPSPEWQVLFNAWGSSCTNNGLEYRDPISNESYVSSTVSKSLSEYLIRRMGVMRHVKPADLKPTSVFGAGDVRLHLLYIIHPHLRPKSQSIPSIIDTSKRLVSNQPGHVYSGALFRKEDLPACLCKDIQHCKDARSLICVIQRNLDFFDTFHHDTHGRFPKGTVRPTNESKSKQPRRTTFSCFITPPSLFPEIGVRVQRLFSYVGGLRPNTDCRCRVMTPLMFSVVVKVWASVRPHLSPVSQVAPPNHVQVLYYFEQFNAAINPHRDRDTRKEEFKIPQIAGTDVLVISIGSEMMFKLISPDYSRGQNHQFTQTDAWQNANRDELSEDICLSDVSVYNHTAHDDALLQHMAYFPANKDGNGPRMRIALLCRSLANSNVYRANGMESPDKRYSLVEAHAFRQLDNMKHASNWWAQLGYKPHEIPWMNFKSESTRDFLVSIKHN